MRHPFWSEGLRPFFLLGAAFAAVSIPLWILLVSGTVELPLRGGLLAWHAHEALYGFITAAIAGFLTTAIPQWTGQKPLSGASLVILSSLWLAGRGAWLIAGALPGWLVAAVDVAFLPVLGLALFAGIVKRRQFRNMPVLVLVTMLAVGNLLTHLDILGVLEDGLETGISLALFSVILLISFIGGRIVPTFTRNALDRAGRGKPVRGRPVLDIAGNLSVAIAGALITFADVPTVSGIAALVAAALSALRLAGWSGWMAWRMPLVWVLHLGYVWIPVGLAAYGLNLLGAGIAAGAAIHALSVGAAATMILAVTSRASLGHTGRPLVAPLPIVVAYILLTLSAAARVLAALDIGAYQPLLHIAATCWSGAFLLFLWIYVPILTRAPQPELSSQPQ
jgi:uncharacterized protein involved in response to NO